MEEKLIEVIKCHIHVCLFGKSSHLFQNDFPRKTLGKSFRKLFGCTFKTLNIRFNRSNMPARRRDYIKITNAHIEVLQIKMAAVSQLEYNNLLPVDDFKYDYRDSEVTVGCGDRKSIYDTKKDVLTAYIYEFEMRSEVKKIFLQACMNHGSLRADQISEILEPISQSYGDIDVLEDVRNLVKDINIDIKEFNQELKFVKHPLLGKEFLVFGLTFETSASKVQHHYREADQLYFAKLLESMAVQEDYGISWVDMYNLPNLPDSAKKDLTKTRVQDLITKWIQQGYFFERDDKLFFGPRMLVEYASHLKTNFSEYIKDCPLCKNLVLWDIKCARCDRKVHKECIRTFLKRRSNCPSCNEVWSTALN